MADRLSAMLVHKYPGAKVDRRDGIRLDLPAGWVQIRKSNTEPIIRVYAEERNRDQAEELAGSVTDIVKNL
jgi:phosphomannomutase